VILHDDDEQQYIDAARGIKVRSGQRLDRDYKRFMLHIDTTDRSYTLEVFDRLEQDLSFHFIDPSLRTRVDNWRVVVGPDPKIMRTIFAADVEPNEFNLDSKFAALAKEVLFAMCYYAYGADALRQTEFTVTM